MTRNRKLERKPEPPITLLDVELKVLPISSLVVNELQPDERTTESALKALREKIKLEHCIVPPVVRKVGGRWLVVDGHRRIKMAEFFGRTEMQCLVLPKNGHDDVQLSFIRHNAGLRPFRGRTWLAVLGLASPQMRVKTLGEMTKEMRSRIEHLIKYLGSRRFYALIPKIKSPLVVFWIDRLAKIFRHYDLDHDIKSLATWVIEHGSRVQIEVLDAEVGPTQRADARNMWRAYRENKALPRVKKTYFRTVRGGKTAKTA